MLPSTLELRQALEYVRSLEADSEWSILGADSYAGKIWCRNMPWDEELLLDCYCELMFQTRVRSVTVV